ncbi:23S rRNA (adenine(2030)-N(6))-methyltransferase RlmJ [Xinfangfangia sp. CPCC 101601]|uniref:Ribosomal RNA large subunit methyltransferase J n=1 Tax=Pseudogemmobacter lacusdianii TaxID=3069608 RepID=A0ABU0VVH1_9RHOB|nr:23S rRNA (adenine(2030)-N(6))-methyltransferase RlmJ [Xinfangfangia sp. CPCC 101601]MDQ2065750.1 23S rRNA (adenine(2030)-N(6))-methyltransferase RlmJ [Xinfangfangia sp. CPCC 101601]
MLSYQHAFHAGNLADLQKHALLAWVFDYLTQKDKPLSYIETHAGRGLYNLTADEAQKTGEAAKGILAHADWFAPEHPYSQRLAETQSMYGDTAYPGSPLIAALGLRETDTIHLAELHPQEHAALAENLGSWGAHLHKADGLDLALAIAPPTPRRGVLLCDPSYEVKEDYERIPRVFAQLARKWNVGTLILWYPILTGGAHGPMLRALEAQHPDHLTHEVRFPPAREGHRMLGSGMFFVNPPWGLEAEAARLTALFKTLS